MKTRNDKRNNKKEGETETEKLGRELKKGKKKNI